MAINFPDSPNNGDIFTSNGKKWIYGGGKWSSYGLALAPDVLKVDSANNRVGVNNLSPSVDLDVTGNAAVSGSLTVDGDLTISGNTTTLNTTELYVEDNKVTLNSGATGSATANAGIEVERGDDPNVEILWDESVDAWKIATDFTVDTDTFHVDSTNNRVGIGTTSPASNLEVTGSGVGNLRVEGNYVGSNNDGYGLHLYGGTPDSTTNAGGRIFLGGGTRGDDLVDAVVFYADTTERMRIDSSGNVGIGESSPSEILHVAGNALIAKGGDTSLTVKSTSDSSSTAFITIGGARTGSSDDNLSQLRFHNFCVQSTGGDYEAARISAVDPSANDANKRGALVFQTSNGGTLAEQMRIDENGVLLLSGGASTTEVPSAVTSAGDAGGLFMFAKTGGGTARLGMWINGDGGPGDLPFVVADSNSSQKCVIYGDGDIDNVSGAIGTLSDASLKQDIVDATSQWDDIKAVHLRNYRLIADVNEQGDDARVYLGVVAQELEAAGMSGLVKTREDGIKSVKSSILYMKAVGALQEALNRIETLEMQNTDLVARIEALEAE